MTAAYRGQMIYLFFVWNSMTPSMESVYGIPDPTSKKYGIPRIKLRKCLEFQCPLYEGQFLYSERYRAIGHLSDSIDWECVHNQV